MSSSSFCQKYLSPSTLAPMDFAYQAEMINFRHLSTATGGELGWKGLEREIKWVVWHVARFNRVAGNFKRLQKLREVIKVIETLLKYSA